MHVFFWAALGVFVVSIVWGTIHVVRRGLRAWQAAASFAAGGAAGMERLADRAERTAVRVDDVNRRVLELEAAVARLQRSLRRAGVLAQALREVRDTLNLVLAFLPR
jgi:hypothetical protein